MQGKR